MSETLSIQDARKLVLHSQGLPPGRQRGRAIEVSLATIEHLGYIQIDTISVIQRAHHHTLWNRNPRYKVNQLDRLVHEKRVFEYWAHAAAYLPMRDYRYTLPRKQAIASGQKHWYRRDKLLMRSILDRIRTEGPLMAKDFEHKGEKLAEWQSKPAKMALENLYMQGDLMILCRNNFHKVYDLTDRVLPDSVDRSVPTPTEYAQFLILQYLRANGMGLAAEFGYLRKNVKICIPKAIETMLGKGELEQIKIGKTSYCILPNALELLNKPLMRRKLKILSPFDNLLIQRKRIQSLFGFDYQIECYVPSVKRKFGYFCLPLLWDGRLVARMDCKADRNQKRLRIHSLILEPRMRKTDSFYEALYNELREFLKFNHCESIETPPEIADPLGIRDTEYI